jgi:hypothetical protein
MPEYEGFVASLIDDDKAEVLIQPEREGIVGRPRHQCESLSLCLQQLSGDDKSIEPFAGRCG